MKTTILFENYMHRSLGRCAFFSLLITCFAFPPMAKAVVPPPDGGYPGFNTAEGQNALFSLTTGVANTAAGWFSLFSNTDGSYNTAVGAGTLLFSVGNQSTGDGTQNTAIGTAALLFNTTGFENTSVGVAALSSNTTGDSNTATGFNALFSNTTGFENTAVGADALLNNTGSENTAIGAGALRNSTTGVVNIALGRIAGLGVTTASNVISIGSLGGNVNDSTWIGNIYGITTQSGTTAPVVVSDGGQLGTVASSEGFKKDIATMDKASEIILSLRPVTFHYKSDARETPQFGLIAEEVAKVNPALVLPDKEGKPYTVRYEAVNAMLLNEFLKAHGKLQEQEATITRLKSTVEKHAATNAQQQNQIEALTVGLQKVSAQLAAASPSRGGLEANKPPLHPIVNNP